MPFSPWRAVRRAVLPAIIMATAPVTARSVGAQSETAQLVSASLAKLDMGDTAAALSMLKTATDRYPQDPGALYWRGRLLARTSASGVGNTPQRMLAWRLLNRGSKSEADDPRFLFEMGLLRLKTPLLQFEAERFLLRARDIAARVGDSTAQSEAAYELGQIRERRYRTTYHRYSYTGGIFFDQFAALNRMHYVREFLQQSSRPIENAGATERHEAEEMYRAALKANSGHSPSARAMLGLLYDQRRYDEMTSVARPFLRDSTPDARLWFGAALARFRAGDAATATSWFAAGLQRLSTDDRREVLDLGSLLRVGDSTRVAGLADGVRAATVTAFWEAADPLLSTPENEAQLEYYSRVAFTMLNYEDRETAHRSGWRTDRGQVILRYGEPPTVALMPEIITVFWYPETERFFVFSGSLGFTAAVFAGDFRELTEATRAIDPFRLDNLALAHQVDSISHQVARFRGNNASEYEVITAARLDVATLYKGVDLDRSALNWSMRLGSPDRMRLIEEVTVPVTLPSIDNEVMTSAKLIPVGDYRLRMEAYDPGVRNASARAQVNLALPKMDASKLSSSDILLAQRVADSGRLLRRRSDAALQPIPATTVAQRDTFAVYWENYGLTPDANGDVLAGVKIAITLVEIVRVGNTATRLFGNIVDIVGLSPEGDQTLSISFDRNEPLSGRDRVPMLVNLGLGSAPVGRYRLEITVTDRVSGTRTTSRRDFSLSPFDRPSL